MGGEEGGRGEGGSEARREVGFLRRQHMAPEVCHEWTLVPRWRAGSGWWEAVRRVGGAWGFAVGQTGVNVAFTVLKKPAPLFSTLRWRHHAMVFRALSAITRVVRVGPCSLCPEGSVGSSSFALLLPGDVLCWSLRLGPGRGTLSCSVPSQCRGLVSVLRRLLPKHGPASPEKLQVK